MNKSSTTSGGGFSTLHLQPSFQSEAVSQYFVNAAAAGQTPFMGYDRTGRGYPDVSLAGRRYAVAMGGKYYAVDGTEVSSSVVAGLFSNINAARIAVGKGSIGWVNPALYKNSNLFVNDITSGNNKCTSSSVVGAPNGFVCCSQGFFTAPGWDPVTGLGSLNYGKMESAFLALGDVNSITYAPTKSPTTPPTAYPTILSQPQTLSPLQSTLQTGDSNRNFHGE